MPLCEPLSPPVCHEIANSSWPMQATRQVRTKTLRQRLRTKWISTQFLIEYDTCDRGLNITYEV